MLLPRMRIRGRLVLLIIIPLIATFTAATVAAIDLTRKASRAAQTAQAVEVAGRVGAIIRDLQRERLLSAGFLRHHVTRGQLLRQQATVTQGAADLLRDLGADAPEDLIIAVDVLYTLGPTRAAVLAGVAEPTAILAAYSTVITVFIDSTHLLEAVDGNTTQGRQVVALDAIMRANEGIATMLSGLAAATTTDDLAPFVPGFAKVTPAISRFVSYASQDQIHFFELALAASDTRLGSGVLLSLINKPAELIHLPYLPSFAALESLTDVGLFVETKIVVDVVATAANSERLETTQVFGFLGVTALTLALTLALAGALARSIAQRLSRLTESADRVARATESELVRVADDDSPAGGPVRFQPIDVAGHDEVGELARAFGRVQQTAAALVERQVASRRNVALMFGHVGRRTQNLVGRQVALIDKLEHEETNPGRLRDLYRLDHVSSRLRRSASSLVVLSGATGADEHMTPAGIGDVARLAVAEIEDYTRVDVETATTLRVVPALIGDLILLIAELMENATASSPPGTRVVVSAIPTPEGARLTVVDHGIGMTESRLDQENARLTSRERIDLAPTEVLGLFVVGRLARRHGLRVALSSTRGGGVTATVDIPSRLLALAVPPAATGPGAAVPVQVARRIERRHDGAPTGVLAIADPKLFDIDALRRADQTMQTVRPWNAFDARRDVPAGSSVAGAEAAAIPRQRENGPGLNRRVPGATLRGLEGVGPAVPTGARAQWTSQPGSLDAGQARDSLADFESGVARALEELDAPQWPT